MPKPPLQVPEIFNFLDIVMNHVADFFISFSFERQQQQQQHYLDTCNIDSGKH